MEIIEIPAEEIDAIRPLWELLNKTHYEKSTQRKCHFNNLTFSKRVEGLRRREKIVIFAAQEQGVLIAYCIASIKQSVGEIDSIFVRNGYRQTGVGKTLLTNAMTWLKEHNVETIKVAIAEGNEAVFPFYEQMGFRKSMTVLEARL